MDLTQHLDGYCERLGPSYWAEPVNAVTNLAFVLVGALCWYRTAGMPLGRVLSAVLMLIGLGSYLFHTHAQTWAMIADVTPIALFILLYVYVANRAFWRLPMWSALLVTLAFFPYTAVTVPIFQALPFFDISAGYWPVPLLIGLYAVLLRKRAPSTAKGLANGAGLLVVSLTFRSVDLLVCSQFPLGTHFAWHLINAAMLGWMIEVYRRHLVAGGQARG